MTLLIRAARQEDAHAIASIEMATIPEFAEFMLADIQPHLQIIDILTFIYSQEGLDSYKSSWVCEDMTTGMICGMITAYPYDLRSKLSKTDKASYKYQHLKQMVTSVPKKSFHITKLGVLQSSRHKGIASRLLETISKTAKETKNINNISLFVWENNHSAQQLYNKAGFKFNHKVYIKEHKNLTKNGFTHLMYKPI